MKVLVMGAGKMVEAILVGFKNKIELGDFHIYSPSGKSAQILAQKVGAVFLESLDDMSYPDFIFIGCKPQQLNQLAPSIVGKFEDATIVSMLAALTEKTQLRVLKAKKLIRIMPNLPVRFNQGVTLISSDSAQEDLPKLNDLFSNLGLVQVLSENELEELTLLTGSGPASFMNLLSSWPKVLAP
jgi:pyrroline-5-carboxylate reductase